jgi:uncharacterized membrane protein YGL010W
METPPASAPFAAKLAYYRTQHQSRGVRATHLVGIPTIVLSFPLLIVRPLVGLSMLVGGWVIQVAGHRVFEGNKPATTKGLITYQLTGLAYWCEEIGDVISRHHRARAQRETATP